MDKTEHNNVPAVVTDYIDAIIKKMRYRKKVRAEVRRELADHFADALAGCNNDDERNAQAQAMIEEFGDAMLLGVLLRRAKKRCRPLWRTLIVRAFQMVGILFMMLILYIGWFFSGRPIITTNYLEVMNSQVRPVADDNQNASPFYRKAIDAFVLPPTLPPADDPSLPPELQPAAPEVLDISPRPLATMTSQEKQFLADWLAANEQSETLIRQGNRKPYYWQTYSTNSETSELMGVLLPDLADYRRLANLLCMKALWQAQHGQLNDSLDTVLESYQFGRHLHNKNILIEQLVAIAIKANAMKSMRIILAEHADQLDKTTLTAVRNHLAEIVSTEDFLIGFEGEKLFMYDEIQRSFTQTRIGSSHLFIQRISRLGSLTGSDYGAAGQWFHILFTHPDREETLAAADRFYAAMDEFARYSPAQLRQKGININERVEELIKGNFFLSILIPALERVAEVAHRSKAESLATLAVLAILEYQKQSGSLPQSLDALVSSGLLQSVPVDPYSNQPLVYKITDAGFTLYSVGPNFNDDDGVMGTDEQGRPRQWSTNSDMLFWPVPERE